MLFCIDNVRAIAIGESPKLNQHGSLQVDLSVQHFGSWNPNDPKDEPLDQNPMCPTVRYTYIQSKSNNIQITVISDLSYHSDVMTPISLSLIGYFIVWVG